MLLAIQRRWFLFALAAVLLSGLTLGSSLLPLTHAIPRIWLIASILFVTTLPIDFRQALAAKGAGGAVVLATLLSTIAAPLLGWLASQMLHPELAIGLFIASASPSTVASAAVWTRRGGGNDAAAVLVTLITNGACFVVLPFWAATLLSQSVDVSGGFLVKKLLLCVVLPMIAAQLLRLLPAVARWSCKNTPSLSVAAQLGVLTIALIGATESGVKLQSLQIPLTLLDWGTMIAAAAAVHLVLLLGGWRLARGLGMRTPEALAVAISGSQKTLTVGVGVALVYGGLAIFPMIAYHLLQLVVDTVFVDRIRSAKATNPEPAPPDGLG